MAKPHEFRPPVYARLLEATQSDTVDEPEGIADGVVAIVSGNIEIVDPEDNVVLISGPLIGMWWPVRCKRVNNTNTTAARVGLLYARPTGE